MSNNYPLGAKNDSNAPWNEPLNPEKEIDVTVSCTLSKTFKIKVSDYNSIAREKDEDGIPYEECDFSDCDLKGAVEEQVILPWEVPYHVRYLTKDDPIAKKAIKDLENWSVDDFEVILE